MTDFEIMVTKLRSDNCGFAEGRHFEIYEWQDAKSIELRPSTMGDEWVIFEYDKNGNLLRIY